jgi:hypothetical protein
VSGEWPDRYGRALAERAGALVETDERVFGAVLELARVVAHASERKHAPLATFLAGQFVARRAHSGVAASAALAEAADVARRLLDGTTDD